MYKLLGLKTIKDVKLQKKSRNILDGFKLMNENCTADLKTNSTVFIVIIWTFCRGPVFSDAVYV